MNNNIITIIKSDNKSDNKKGIAFPFSMNFMLFSIKEKSLFRKWKRR